MITPSESLLVSEDLYDAKCGLTYQRTYESYLGQICSIYAAASGAHRGP